MRIEQFEDAYDGERIFVIGNGPSLNQIPLEKLNDEYTIATNKINHIYDDTDWRPDFYSYMQSKRSTDVNEFLTDTIQLEIPCFIASEFNSILPNEDNIIYLDRIVHKDPRYECLDNPDFPDAAIDYWSDDISNIIHVYNTSVYPLFQISSYMGFSEIFLVGCDLGIDTLNHLIFKEASDPTLFREKYKHTYDETSKSHALYKFIFDSGKPAKSIINLFHYFITDNILSIDIADSYHFSDTYQNSVSTKQGEDDRMRRAHNLAYQKLSQRDIRVKNATIGGELEVYPRRDIYSILDE